MNLNSRKGEFVLLKMNLNPLKNVIQRLHNQAYRQVPQYAHQQVNDTAMERQIMEVISQTLTQIWVRI